MQKRRVAVTGIGVVSAFGLGREVFCDNIFAGVSGVRRVERFDPAVFPCVIGAPRPEYDAAPFFREPKDARRFEPVVTLAVTAAKMAVEQSGLDLSNAISELTGVYVSSGIGGLITLQEQITRANEKGYDRISPFFIVNSISNMPAGVISIELGVTGPSYCVVSACASSGHALGEAMREIQYGRMTAMIAGGTEAALNESGLGGFCAMKAVTFDFNAEPARGSRPFDAKRSGFVMGEGACIFVLEEWEHARARGAQILAELVGYGASSDANHFTAPHPEGRGAQLAMRAALEDAGLPPEAVGYVNAHGTSTPLNDRIETYALRQVYGGHADKLLVSSTKSMHGHLLGAAAAIESAACVEAFRRGQVPPTANYEFPDPDCDLNYVPNQPLPWEGEYAMCNTFGFGGQNAVLLLKKAG